MIQKTTLLERLAVGPGPVLPGSLQEPYAALWRGLAQVLPTHAAALGIVSVTARGGAAAAAVQLAEGAVELTLGAVLLLEAAEQSPGLSEREALPDSRGFAELLCLPQHPGLAEWRTGQAELEACLHETGIDHLAALTAGSTGSCRASGWTASTAGPASQTLPPASVLAELKARFPLVVCSLGAAQDPAFPADFVGALDGLLLVIEAEGVEEVAARRVKQQLLAQGGRLLGVLWRPAADERRRS